MLAATAAQDCPEADYTLDARPLSAYTKSIPNTKKMMVEILDFESDKLDH